MIMLPKAGNGMQIIQKHKGKLFQREKRRNKKGVKNGKYLLSGGL